MPRRGLAAIGITTVALILLLNFKTPADAQQVRSGTVAIVEPGASTTPPAATARPGASAMPGATSAPGATATPPSATATPRAATATVVGPVVSTRFGPVQVEVIVAEGRVTDVVALQLPTGRHSGQISDYSAPILREEALTAQSSAIDLVSGATYTSDAYARSLQAALDKAGVA